MAQASRSYNCTILWEIENFHIQRSSNFCDPIAEVETLNSEKWKLELNLRPQVGLKWKTSLKMVKLSGDLDMPVERRATIVSEVGNVELSVGNHLKKQPQSVREMLFDFDYPCEKYFKCGHVGLKIELGFVVDDLAFSTTVRTVFKTETCSFRWSLKDISKGYNTLEYPVSVHIPGFFEFTLLFLRKRADDKTGHDAYLGLKSSNNITHFLGSDCRPARHSCVAFVKGSINDRKIDTAVFKEFTSTSEVLELISSEFPEHFDLFFLLVFCDGTSESLQLETVYSSLETETPFVIEKFHAGESLFKNMNFSDVTLKAGNKQFEAHRSVLSSVSPVFGAMFENDMTETVTGVVNIEDVEPSTLRKMLKFIYTGETGDDWSFDRYEKLLAAAHKYSISSLRDLCSRRLVSLLTEKNIVRVLHLGYLYNDERLKSAAKSLFSTNPELILISKEWNDYVDDCFSKESSVVDKLKKSLHAIKGKASSFVPPSVSKLFKKRDEKETEEG